MTERESEIAAKIDSLRRQRKLPSQKATTAANASNATTNEPENLTDGSDEMFASTIAEGEALFGTAPKPSTSEKYRPKVSTWGLYPRPQNISRTFGGGRKLPLGGERKQTAESVAYDTRVAEKLARYRGGSSADAALEAEHADEIRGAMKEAEIMMTRGYGYDATRLLRPLLQYATARSRLGGELRLALALACEDSGRRSEAREIYSAILRENKFNDIRQKVKRLSAGFADMEKMRVSDGSSDGLLGFRSEDFYIPDIAAYDDRRFRGSGVVIEMTAEERRKEAVALAATLAVLMGFPAAVVLLLRTVAQISTVT